MLDTVRGRITIPWKKDIFEKIIPNWEMSKKLITDADGTERKTVQLIHENGMFITGDEKQSYIIQCSLPRVLFGDNTNLIKDENSLNQAFDKMRLQMLEVLEFDTIPRWTRLDLVWNFIGDIDEYIATFQNTKHPSVRNPVRVFQGESITWGGKYTTLQIYDKLKEKGAAGYRTSERRNTIVRCELRKTIRTSKKDLNTKNDLTMQLCEPVINGYLPNFNKLYKYYREQVTLLSPKSIPSIASRSPLDFLAYLQANQLKDHNDTPLVSLYLSQRSKASKYRLMRELKARVLRYKFISFNAMLPEDRTPTPIGYNDLAKSA